MTTIKESLYENLYDEFYKKNEIFNNVLSSFINDVNKLNQSFSMPPSQNIDNFINDVTTIIDAIPDFKIEEENLKIIVNGTVFINETTKDPNSIVQKTLGIAFEKIKSLIKESTDPVITVISSIIFLNETINDFDSNDFICLMDKIFNDIDSIFGYDESLDDYIEDVNEKMDSIGLDIHGYFDPYIIINKFEDEETLLQLVFIYELIKDCIKTRPSVGLGSPWYGLTILTNKKWII